MPFALERLDLNQYDIVVSSEAGPAKWVLTRPDAIHICYCHSPLRYIWDQQHVYLQRLPVALRLMAQLYASHLRKSDLLSAARVDYFIANSEFVRQRIKKFYRRDAYVIHPPVATTEFHPDPAPDDYYLFAGEIRRYKRPDLAIQACTNLGRRLIVLGEGPHISELRAFAGPTVEFRDRVSFAELKVTMARCRALLFPGVEDFGIIPVEVMASGRPVIAYARGGATETVVDGETGILYTENSVKGLSDAILRFEAAEVSFGPEACVRRARDFDTEVFLQRFEGFVESVRSSLTEPLFVESDDIQPHTAK